MEHTGIARLEREPVLEVSETVKSGETAGKILLPYLSSAEIQAVSDACADVFHLRRIRQGKPYTLTTYNGSFVSFVYEIDNDQKLIVERHEGAFRAKLENIVYDVTVARVQGAIRSHLFQAVSDAGEGPALAIAMAEIFAWEINFIRDLRPQDSFTLLVEKRYREGEFKGYGRILGAMFINQGTTYEAFCFRDADGFPHYYTSKGESVKRAFLKAPLSFTRISSTFSPKRLHPILKVWRAHPGIDYAAPTGTPVKAVGSGTVTFKGWGKGAGNYIALRHNNNFETMYLHLSGFARGLEKGKKVQQGEVIGFVGSTGYSTGPHLDFRMKKDGQYINPLHMVSPRTEPVRKKDFPEFQILMDNLRPKLLNEAATPPTPAPPAG
ncbi:peptidoglycan DD-metalloendopeptidase family protein [Desulfovibrio sp. OttesenSCG-928-O18]|nr:peptidoglycan DD-metalloendopeptidase family protein [Desulfovibrio sp. OttesenSCG-928-O18]